MRVALGAAMVLSACGPSFERVDPDAAPLEQTPAQDARLVARVVGDDGEPVAGQAVEVYEVASASDIFAGVFVTIFSFGLCFLAIDLNDPELPCFPENPEVSGSTDDTGRFEVTLPAAYREGYVGDHHWVARAAREAAEGALAGPMTSMDFRVRAAVHEAPDLALWTTDVEAPVTDDAAAVEWSTTPPGGADGAGFSVAWLDARGYPVWTVRPASSGMRLDARLLEDTNGTVTVAAERTVTRDEVEYELTFTAPQVAYAGEAGAPPSRGATCSVVLDDGSELPIGVCPVTDGDFSGQLNNTDRTPETAAVADRTEAVVVDLGGAHRIGMVVARGRCSTCTVEISDDGETWRAIPAAHNDTALLAVADGPEAHYVRVAGPATGLVDGVSEVSVWEPVERPQPEVAEDRGRGSDSGAALGLLPADDGGRSALAVGLILVAAALVAGALLTIGVLLGRRLAAPRA
ncbi:MAG: hypothetical protein ACRD29_25775 [Acidimicrobiales bacterium]